MIEMTILKDREAWLQNRYKGIGGSEISAVVGCNPYMNNVKLFELKTGRIEAEDISEKPYVIYGTKAEEHIRALFELDYPEYKVEYIENNSFYNSKYPWARASLDGWLTDQEGRKGILEIKTTEILNSMHREKWNQQIPQNYYCQVLFYMAVFEADFAAIRARLKSRFKDGIYIQEKTEFLERKEVQADIDYLMKKGSEFWEYVKNDRYPHPVLPEF